MICNRYLTACANDFCREAKRQTISAQDVMQAIKELEFGELEEPLKEYLDQVLYYNRKFTPHVATKRHIVTATLPRGVLSEQRRFFASFCAPQHLPHVEKNGSFILHFPVLLLCSRWARSVDVYKFMIPCTCLGAGWRHNVCAADEHTVETFQH